MYELNCIFYQNIGKVISCEQPIIALDSFLVKSSTSSTSVSSLVPFRLSLMAIINLFPRRPTLPPEPRVFTKLLFPVIQSPLKVTSGSETRFGAIRCNEKIVVFIGQYPITIEKDAVDSRPIQGILENGIAISREAISGFQTGGTRWSWRAPTGHQIT